MVLGGWVFIMSEEPEKGRVTHAQGGGARESSRSFPGVVKGAPQSKETAHPLDPTLGPCLETYEGPRGECRFFFPEGVGEEV